MSKLICGKTYNIVYLKYKRKKLHIWHAYWTLKKSNDTKVMQWPCDLDLFFFLLKMTILDHVVDGGSRVLQTHFFRNHNNKWIYVILIRS